MNKKAVKITMLLLLVGASVLLAAFLLSRGEGEQEVQRDEVYSVPGFGPQAGSLIPDESINLSPAAVTLSPDQKSAEVTLTNTSDAELSLSMLFRRYARTDRFGRPQYSARSGKELLRVRPGVLSLAPGARRQITLTALRPGPYYGTLEVSTTLPDSRTGSDGSSLPIRQSTLVGLDVAVAGRGQSGDAQVLRSYMQEVDGKAVPRALVRGAGDFRSVVNGFFSLRRGDGPWRTVPFAPGQTVLPGQEREIIPVLQGSQFPPGRYLVRAQIVSAQAEKAAQQEESEVKKRVSSSSSKTLRLDANVDPESVYTEEELRVYLSLANLSPKALRPRLRISLPGTAQSQDITISKLDPEKGASTVVDLVAPKQAGNYRVLVRAYDGQEWSEQSFPIVISEATFRQLPLLGSGPVSVVLFLLGALLLLAIPTGIVLLLLSAFRRRGDKKQKRGSR